VCFIEAKLTSDISKGTKNNPERDQILRNVDLGSWYAGIRDFYFALLVLDENHSPEGVKLLRQYKDLPNHMKDKKRLPHRSDGLTNMKKMGLLTWADMVIILRECQVKAQREDEKAIAGRAADWLHEKLSHGFRRGRKSTTPSGA
jgi:hypothetical protein